MDERERHAQGMAMRRKMLGDAHVDAAQAAAGDAGAELQDLLTRYAWGEIWTRPGLDPRARRILVLGTLIALGRWDELAMHARAALSRGELSARELGEVVLQQAIYSGGPAANAAFRALADLLRGPGAADATPPEAE
jgi:alkylhydroperoxidase/carboxymuconolactone decarboxylase family protein YurZ